jgi:hypothetical protein
MEFGIVAPNSMGIQIHKLLNPESVKQTHIYGPWIAEPIQVAWYIAKCYNKTWMVHCIRMVPMQVAAARSGVSSTRRLACIVRSGWARGQRGRYRYRLHGAGGTASIGAVAVGTGSGGL